MNRKQSRHDKVASVFRPGRVVAAGSLILASFAAAGIASGSSVDTGTAALTIGVFNPFSGADAGFGALMIAGCLPAAAAIEAAGGILKHKTLNCKISDSRGDPADAVPAASQLVATTSNLVGIVGPSSDEASATVPIFNRSKMPMFGDTGQATFDKSSYRYFYRITPPDDATGYAMAVYAMAANEPPCMLSGPATKKKPDTLINSAASPRSATVAMTRMAITKIASGSPKIDPEPARTVARFSGPPARHRRDVANGHETDQPGRYRSMPW